MCPIKTSKEYKLLLQQLGSDLAVVYTWKLFNNNYPPTLMSTSELKKTLGVRSGMSGRQLNNFADKLRAYNNRYNTYHSYTTRQRGQSDSYDVILHPNYLSPYHTRRVKNLLESTDEIEKSSVIEYTSNTYYNYKTNEFFVDGELFPTVTDANSALNYQVKESFNKNRYKPNELAAIEEAGPVMTDMLTKIEPYHESETLDQDSANDIQEELAQEYAEEQGLWIEDVDEHFSNLYGDIIGQGQESKVYLDKTNNKVIKTSNTLQYRDLQDFLEGIIMRNTYFPNTKLTILGFGTNKDGDFNVILQQDYIEYEREATEEEIQTITDSMNLEKRENRTNGYKNEDILLADLAPRNVVVLASGELMVLDPIMHMNTPIWNEGGTRGTADNSENYYQNEESPLGAFDSLNNIIYALTNPDQSTFPHELGHYFLRTLEKQNSPDLQIVLDWINEKRGTSYKSWQNLTEAEKRSVHEDFANGFVVYLHEGRTVKPANSNINNIFKKFSNWLKDVIKEVKSILGIELNDSIREVYDRILGLEYLEMPSKEKPKVTKTTTKKTGSKKSTTKKQDVVKEVVEEIPIVEQKGVSSDSLEITPDPKKTEAYYTVLEIGEMFFITDSATNTEQYGDDTGYYSAEEAQDAIREIAGSYTPVEKTTTNSTLYNENEVVETEVEVLTPQEQTEETNVEEEEFYIENPLSEDNIDSTSPTSWFILDNNGNKLEGTYSSEEDALTVLNRYNRGEIDLKIEEVEEEVLVETPVETETTVVDRVITIKDLKVSKEPIDSNGTHTITYTNSKGKKEVILYIKKDNNGEWYDINGQYIDGDPLDTYESVEELLEYFVADINEANGYSEQVEEDTKYYDIMVYDRYGNPTEVTVKIVDTFFESNNRNQKIKHYKMQDIHGNEYITSKLGESSYVEKFTDQPIIEQPKSLQNKGDVVYYNHNGVEKYGTVQKVEVYRDKDQKFQIRYTIDGIIINEQNLKPLAESFPKEEKKELRKQFTNQSLKNIIINIQNKFETLFGLSIPIRNVDLGGTALARYNKGVIEVDENYINSLGDVNIAEVITHEFMHPFVKALALQNNALYQSLLEQLEESGEREVIENEIDNELIYQGLSKQDYNEEVLTRYLGRVISRIFNPSTGRVDVDYVSSLSERTMDVFSRLVEWLRNFINTILKGIHKGRSFDAFIEDFNSSKKDKDALLKPFITEAYAESPTLANRTKNYRYQYDKFTQAYTTNKKTKKYPEGFKTEVHDALIKDGKEHLIPALDKAVEDYVNNNTSKYKIEVDPLAVSLINVAENDGYYTIYLREDIKNNGEAYGSIILQHLSELYKNGEINKDNYLALDSSIKQAYYAQSNKDSNKGGFTRRLKINEINPMLTLTELTDLLSIQLGRSEMMDEYYRLSRLEEKGKLDEAGKKQLAFYNSLSMNMFPDVQLDFSEVKEESAFRLLEANMAVSDKYSKTARNRITQALDHLYNVGKNYKSDFLKKEANLLKFLNTNTVDDIEFLDAYIQEAITSIGIANRKFYDIVKDVKSRTGEIGRAELNRLNKEFIVVRQMLAFHSQFEDVMSYVYKDSKNPFKYNEYLKASSAISRIKQNMEDATIDLTVEWLLPYAEAHNKYMTEQGYTEPKYQITAEDLKNHFKYGVGEDTGFISYWLGSNVTSRNAINAIVANTINQDLMITNIDVNNASMDISVAYREFLKEKGFNNITSKQASEYYKKNYLRKATILQRIWDKNTQDYKDEYVEKWALHQEYYYDLFEKDLDAFKASLPTPKTIQQEQDNEDAVIKWKQSNGFKYDVKTGKVTLSDKYRNPHYSKVSSEPMFKQLEEKYNKANQNYGDQKLKFGIIPQKYDDNILKQLRDSIGDLKTEKNIQDKFDVIKQKLKDHFQFSTERKESANIDDTAFRTLNTTLTTLIDDNNIDLSLHETITDFISESYRYAALKATQYNAENLIMLLEGNSKFGINARTLAQTDVSLLIASKDRYENSLKELKRLKKAKEKGEPVDDDRIKKLEEVVSKGYKGKHRYDSAVKELNTLLEEQKKGKAVDINRIDELQRIVKKGDSERPIRDKFSGNILTPKDPRANKMLIAQINQIYFGNDVEDWNINMLNNISAKKLAHYLSMYESIIRMGGNVIAASNNVTMGNLHMFIEAHGGRYYNKKTLLKASTKYMANIHNYLMDTKNPIKSKEAQLAIQWDAIQGEIQDEFGKKVSGSLASKFFRSGSFFFLTAAGEHQLQMTNMMAMAMAKKVKTKKGETISLYDAYVKDSNGRYSLRTDLENFGKDDLLKFMRDLQGVNRSLNGNYSEFNKTMLQRKWYGNLLMKFRKWMYPSIRARWGSERVDFERNIVEVGYYRYFFNDYLKNGILKMIKGENGFGVKELKPHERYALRKSIMEIGFYLGLTLLASSMFGGEDDKADLTAFEKYSLLLMVRLHADMEIYHGGIPNVVTAAIPGVEFKMPNPIKEPMKILKNPSASTNTISNFIKVLDLLGEPSAVYEQSGPGYKKGESKLWINTRKLLPFKQFLDIYEGRFEGTIDNQLSYYDMINKGIQGVTPRKSTM